MGGTVAWGTVGGSYQQNEESDCLTITSMNRHGVSIIKDTTFALHYLCARRGYGSNPLTKYRRQRVSRVISRRERIGGEKHDH